MRFVILCAVKRKETLYILLGSRDRDKGGRLLRGC